PAILLAQLGEAHFVFLPLLREREVLAEVVVAGVFADLAVWVRVHVRQLQAHGRAGFLAHFGFERDAGVLRGVVQTTLGDTQADDRAPRHARIARGGLPAHVRCELGTRGAALTRFELARRF